MLQYLFVQVLTTTLIKIYQEKDLIRLQRHFNKNHFPTEYELQFLRGRHLAGVDFMVKANQFEKTQGADFSKLGRFRYPAMVDVRVEQNAPADWNCRMEKSLVLKN